MIKHPLLASILLALSATFSLSAFSSDNPPVYGRELMTEQEREEHQQRMRNARNEQEREKIRSEHHERMKLRAKEQGVKLPDKPPARGYQNRGQGMGAGGGQGGGKGGGQGGGMGKGNR